MSYNQISSFEEDIQHNDGSSFVVMAGNIGSGKTTLTNKLCEYFGWRPHFESVQDNPYLEDFYNSMTRWSFPLQVYFLTHRFNTHQMIERTNGAAVQDRSIYEDAHVFARALHAQGQMESRDYENYLGLYRSMTKMLRPPSLLIFLHRSVPKLLERIALRGRAYEKSISVDYLELLNNYYYEWFENYNLGPSLLINTDDTDFLHNEAHFDELIGKVSSLIHTSNKKRKNDSTYVMRPN